MSKKIEKFDPTTGDCKTISQKIFEKCELECVTRYFKEWITNIKLLIGDIQNMDVHIDVTK